MEAYFLAEQDLTKLMNWLEKRGPVFVATRDEEGTVGLRKYTEVGEFKYPGVRSFQPLKPFFFSALEEVAEYPSREAKVQESQPFTIVGAAGCDLRAIEALDRVFLEGEFKDPFYEERRKKALIIGGKNVLDPIILRISQCTF